MSIVELILDILSFISDIQFAKRYRCGEMILWSIAEFVLFVICAFWFVGKIYILAAICFVGFLLSTVFSTIYYCKKIKNAHKAETSEQKDI